MNDHETLLEWEMSTVGTSTLKQYSIPNICLEKVIAKVRTVCEGIICPVKFVSNVSWGKVYCLNIEC